jgi:hypothetical protein
MPVNIVSKECHYKVTLMGNNLLTHLFTCISCLWITCGQPVDNLFTALLQPLLSQAILARFYPILALVHSGTFLVHFQKCTFDTDNYAGTFL